MDCWRLLKRIGNCCIVALLCACALQSPEQRRLNATQIAAQAGWQRQLVSAAPFNLVAYRPALFPALVTTLTVYIEGDGVAWINRSLVSLDPTPQDPIALKLALRDPSATAIYLARPCQYVDEQEAQACGLTWWTQQRFAPTVVQAMSHAIDVLQQQTGAQHLVLVGYSGGGALAALIAAQRTDVALLLTVAGNLDHVAWTRLHRVAPLTGSLNPADEWRALADIPQQHWVGGQDMIVPVAIAQSYAARFPKQQQPVIQVIPEFDHHCCWEERWVELLSTVRR